MIGQCLVFLLLAESAFGENLTKFFQKKNCDPKCTFETQNLTSHSLAFFPTDCSTVCTHLSINEHTDLTEAQLASTFLSMKRLIGSLTVMDTKFKSISFLAGLEAVECGQYSIVLDFNNQMIEFGLTNLTSISCSNFEIIGYKKLRNLGFPNLKSITLDEFSSPFDEFVRLYIDPDSIDFCITVEEMETLISAEDVNVDGIYGKYCTPTTSENLCTFPEICPKIFGDVEVGSSSSIDSLKFMEIIFGSLIINGTNLTNFNFLENLKYVAQLTKGKSAVIVQNNPLLLNVSFPKLKRVRSDNLHTVVFTKNNRNLSLDVNACFGLRSDLGITTHWSPTFDGENCYLINDTANWLKKNKASSNQGSLGLLIFISALIFADLTSTFSGF
ncbi:Receptor L-domain domain-containing protein [Caenorhabditis elegans]|uniref:Receptor L-domain domain-containing protein n=1 Tax=Caenorhabditis elegans TaxID=6239 RepID=M1ZMJ0_CAEEL|nr:Receptor L-domain domain-containing protein [Caenorhabditis elegans]CCU83344.2 Receptor L-domain domain-containing protein [Caenorhabditis elegans]|eukprot:NP_001294738.2 Uncharacterized protein CELE_Y19D10B.8 [Caenorhabditis elegans]